MSVISLLLSILLVLVTCSAESLTTGDDVREFVATKIRDNEVMVFAKSYCPHCKATRALLKTIRSSIDIQINFLDLDKMDEDDGPLVQMELLQLTGQRTVPNVFIGGRHLGGNSDVQELAANGQLQHRLNDVIMARSDHVKSRGELHQTL